MFQRIPLLYLVSTGWKYAGKFRPLMVITFVMFALSQSISLSEPYVIGKMLNAVQENVTNHAPASKMIQDVTRYLGFYFAIQMGFWLFHGPGRILERILQFQIQVNYKSRLFQIVTELPLQWHREHHSGDSIDKINRASTSLAEFFDNSFQVTYMFFRFFGTQIILFFFMPVAGCAAMFTACVALGIICLFDSVLIKQYAEINRIDNKVASAVHDYVTNIVSVITLRLEEPVLREVQRRMVARKKLTVKNAVMVEVKWMLTTVFICTMIVCVLFWNVNKTVSAGGMLLTGTFFTLFEYLRRIGDSFYNFAQFYGVVVRHTANVRNADALLEASEKYELATRDYVLPDGWKEVQIRGLHFTYEDERHRTHHLENVNVDLKRGTSVALVGESGSGKSTLLNLLRGLQETDRVEVSCDGIRLQGKLAHLSHSATLMPQEPEIFADTIRTNITFALGDDQSRLDKAVDMARFGLVMARLPNGFETNIAEKGVNLSGGEKQRLALARGIYFAQDSSLVLLDEPTSSVDTINERLIYERILSEYPDKCIVSAMHKLHLLEMFDHVYVFDNGNLIESGSFKQLVAEGGKLTAMWNNYQATQDETVGDLAR